MNPKVERMLRTLVPHREPVGSTGRGAASANIALCKYWGKRDEALKLPQTGSLSVSLGPLGTETTLSISDRDVLTLNGRDTVPGDAASLRVFRYLDGFRPTGAGFRVDSVNTLPMAAGLASSASAFAALARALDDLFQWNLDDRALSILARIGSGSACRSLFNGFVEWHPGDREDGLDSFATPLETEWPEFRIGILTLSSSRKPVGSGAGMRRTRDTSVLYDAWPAEVARALPRIREAVASRDIDALGAAAEQNALAMHATMIAAWPPLLYWRPESVDALHRIHALRADGLSVYATMDAGPNVKLLFTEPDEDVLRGHFPDLQIVRPFVDRYFPSVTTATSVGRDPRGTP